MTTPSIKQMTDLLAPFGPTKPIPELVVEVNRIFHAFEAEEYDRRHPEIHDQLPALWREMLELVNRGEPRAWSVLDVGAGTGFATEQALRHLSAAAFRRVTCFDPSREMLARCRARIAPLVTHAEFLEHLPQVTGTYNLLLTNSVLHHLPDVERTLHSIEMLLTKDASWIAGHEPSSRFYMNPECWGHLRAFRRSNRWTRFLRPDKYLARIRRLVVGDPLTGSAKQAHRAGLFGRVPSPTVIDSLVDFGVAKTLDEARAGRGLDVRRLEQLLAGRWELQFMRSYSYMGEIFEGGLPASWRKSCAELRQRFPEDGANFCSVWRRVG